MTPDYESIFDECLARIRAGESIRACLDAYPKHAQELCPLLTLAAEIIALSPVTCRPEAKEAGLARLQQALRQNTSTRPAPCQDDPPRLQ